MRRLSRMLQELGIIGLQSGENVQSSMSIYSQRSLTNESDCTFE